MGARITATMRREYDDDDDDDNDGYDYDYHDHVILHYRTLTKSLKCLATFCSTVK